MIRHAVSEQLVHPHFDFRIIVDHGVAFVGHRLTAPHVGALARHHD